MGKILAARDRRLHRDVAIKVLRERGAASARFEREALITARLQHPSIVRVYDAGRLAGDPFYAMERVRGRALDPVTSVGPARPATVSTVAVAVAAVDGTTVAASAVSPPPVSVPP
jgi:serine/threonine protein kinase